MPQDPDQNRLEWKLDDLIDRIPEGKVLVIYPSQDDDEEEWYHRAELRTYRHISQAPERSWLGTTALEAIENAITNEEEGGDA